MSYEVAVIERYPDGTKWTHYFVTKEQAEEAVDMAKTAHPARNYEIRLVNK